jgi:hypothetical protein
MIAGSCFPPWDVLPTEIERGGQDQRSRPPVDGVELQRLVVTPDVRDKPDDEPEKGHKLSFRSEGRNLCSTQSLPARGDAAIREATACGRRVFRRFDHGSGAHRSTGRLRAIESDAMHDLAFELEDAIAV